MNASLDQLRRTLDAHATDVDDTALHPVRRAHAVTRRARARRRRRTAGVVLAAGLAGSAVVATVTVNNAAPTPSPVADAPQGQWIAGAYYPGTLRVDGSTYTLGSSYVIGRGGRWGTLETVAAETSPRVLAWSTTPSTRGFVTVRIDGVVRSRSTAGALESGLVLRPGRAHRVVVGAPSLRKDEQIGIALYDLPDQ